MHGFQNIVELLLKKGAKVDVTNTLGVNALHSAVIRNHLQKLYEPFKKMGNGWELILENEGRPDEVVKLLLDYGADVNVLSSANQKGYE